MASWLKISVLVKDVIGWEQGLVGHMLDLTIGKKESGIKEILSLGVGIDTRGTHHDSNIPGGLCKRLYGLVCSGDKIGEFQKVTRWIATGRQFAEADDISLLTPCSFYGCKHFTDITFEIAYMDVELCKSDTHGLEE